MHVCALSRGGPIGDLLAREGVPVHVIGRRWSADPTTFRRLLRHVNQLRPDSIHAWQATGRAYAAAAARCCGVKRLVAVWREVPIHRGPLAAAIDRYAGRRASAVVATFPALRDYCIEQGMAAEKNRSHSQRHGPGGRRALPREGRSSIGSACRNPSV